MTKAASVISDKKFASSHIKREPSEFYLQTTYAHPFVRPKFGGSQLSTK